MTDRSHKLTCMSQWQERSLFWKSASCSLTLCRNTPERFWYHMEKGAIGQMRPKKKKVTLLNWTLSSKFGFCQTHQTEAWWWQHSIVGVSLQWGLANWSGLKGKWMLLSTPKSLRKTCLSLLHSWRWAGRSTSNMTTILNIPPAEQRSALKDCQVRVLDFDPIQKSVDGLWEQSFAAHHRIWFNFNNSARKNWQKLP